MRAQSPCAASLRTHARLRCEIKLVMMQRGPLLILSLWFCIGVHAQVGFKTTLSASGIEYLKNVGIEVLEQQLSTITLPDISVGSVSYTLSSIVLKNLTIPSSTVTLLPSSSVQLDTQNTAASMTMDWEYKEDSFPHVSDHGSADVSVSSTSIGVTISLSEANGLPVATTTGCDVSIGSLNIDVHGGASWLYNWFIGEFSGTIKNAAEDALNDQIPKSINQGLASAFNSLPVTEKVSSGVEINYELETPPAVTTSYFTLSVRGEFYDIADPQSAPFTPSPLPDIATDEMVQMFISDFTANSASFVFFTENQMQITITDSMLPADAPLRLNTTYFTELIPQLTKAYPNQMFELFVAAIDTPVATFASDGAHVLANGELQVVMLPDKNVAFTLGVKVLTAGTAALSTLNITGHLTFVNLTLSLMNSSIGDFDVSTLNDIVGTLVTDGLLPMGNKILAAGFPLPTITGLTFVSPVIGWGDSYLYVSTDATYVPTGEAEAVEKITTAAKVVE